MHCSVSRRQPDQDQGVWHRERHEMRDQMQRILDIMTLIMVMQYNDNNNRRSRCSSSSNCDYPQLAIMSS